MRFAYRDLGEQREGTTVAFHLRGSRANVLLLDQRNYGFYRAGKPFLYTGGHYTHSPVELAIPEDGHWYAVVDLGGYKGKVRATVEVLAAGGTPSEAGSEALDEGDREAPSAA